MSNHPLIVGIGELLWDRLPTGNRVGGAPANVAYHASCLGAEGYVISAVGNDKMGKSLLEEIGKTKLHTCDFFAHISVKKRIFICKYNIFIVYLH